MAVDLMSMPLSTYWSGNYVTPVMRSCWADGLPYGIMTPDGPLDLPPGSVIGGPDAAEGERDLREGFVAGLLDALPEGFDRWDETPRPDIWFQRFDVHALDALLEEAAARAAGPTQLLDGQLFLPCAEGRMFRAADMTFGSLGGLRYELENATWGAEARDAVETFLAGVTAAQGLRLPLVIDA